MKTVITTLIILAITLFSSCENKTKSDMQTEKITSIKKEATMKKVVFVLTSHEDLGNTCKKNRVLVRRIF